MPHSDTKQKIYDELEDLNLFQWQKYSKKITKDIAEKHNLDEEFVKQVIADWQASYK